MSENKQNYFEILIDRYNRGTITDSQRELLDNFLEEKYGDGEWDAELMGDREELKTIIQKRIQHKTKKKVFNLKPYYYAAASVAVLFGLFFFLKQDTRNIQFATTTHIDSLSLADGTKIILSPQSVLEYTDGLKGEKRKVHLFKGNAFFQVARDTTRPFIVSHGELQTQVLGTSFNIRLDSLQTTVDVISGKVRVSDGKGQHALLVKNQRVVYDEKALVLSQKESSDLPQWYGSNIALRDIELRQLSKFMELRYGYSLKLLDPELYHNRLSVNISLEDDIQSVIAQLKYITNLEFKIHENEIIVQ